MCTFAKNLQKHIYMKKAILMAVVACLIILSGCTASSGSNSPDEPKKASKGYVKVNFSTEGLATEFVKMKVFINGEQKALLGTTETEFVSKDIDISKAVNIVIEPEFTDIEAPAEKFDFGYDFSYTVGVSSDEGKSFSSLQRDNENKSGAGINPDAFDKTIEKTKELLKRLEFTIENGGVK